MRTSGVLMPISSLPSQYGIGTMGKEARRFVDFLEKGGQTYWQILPICPTSYGDSPYQSFSSFAGNPYFISLEDLIEEGVLTQKECDAVDFGSDPASVDYAKLYKGRIILLRKAYERSNVGENEEFRRFQEEEAWWLKDYALFMAVKQRFEGKPWSEWAEDIRLRWQNALDYYRRELYFEIEFQEYMQFKFRQQWMKLKAYANKQGIEIIGDIPIYVAFDSADAWANPELFQFDENSEPTAVAGCPPDAFSATGQLWGNPLYNWEYHASTGFAWWIQRLKYCFKLYDVVRVDHFRGFDEYYAIPYGNETAEFGAWQKGPGIDLFRAVKQALGDVNIIAEDLGYLTDSVLKLLQDTGYPGMKVLQFAFDSREESDYLPHNYNKNCVVYTGTHDNSTVRGWYKEIDDLDKKMCMDYINSDDSDEENISWDLICIAMRSVANTCVIPVQDFLGLDESARINTPSTLGDNWKWRMTLGCFSQELIDKIKRLTKIYGRI